MINTNKYIYLSLKNTMGCNLGKNTSDVIYEPLEKQTININTNDDQVKKIIKKNTIYNFSITENDRIAFIHHFGTYLKFICDIIKKNVSVSDFSPLELWVKKRHQYNRDIYYKDYKIFGYALCYASLDIAPITLYNKVIKYDITSISITPDCFRRVLSHKNYTIYNKAVLLALLLGSAIVEIHKY